MSIHAKKRRRNFTVNDGSERASARPERVLLTPVSGATRMASILTNRAPTRSFMHTPMLAGNLVG